MAAQFPAALHVAKKVAKTLGGFSARNKTEVDQEAELVAITTKLGKIASTPTTPGQVLTVTAAGNTAYATVPLRTVNAQTGTTYSVAVGDAQKIVTCTNASPVTVSMQTDVLAAILIGQTVDIVQYGAGAVTVQAGAGATCVPATLATTAQYGKISATKIAANTWLLTV